MLGPRTGTELLNLAAGLALTFAIFRAAQWAYPLGRVQIGEVGWVTVAIVLLLGVGPVRAALRTDREASTDGG